MHGTWRTKGIYKGPEHAKIRRMMEAGGLFPGDSDKPLIGIHNTYGEGGPGHFQLRMIADEVRAGILQAGGVPIEFGGPSHCIKAIEVGTFRHDLPQRDIIANSVENFVELSSLDGLVCVGSCDKPNPAHWLAAARLRHIPIIMALGGPGFEPSYRGIRTTDTLANVPGLVDAAREAGLVDDLNGLSLQQMIENESLVCRYPGACAVCGTASSGAFISEVLGLTLPGGGTAPFTSPKRRWLSRLTGRRVVEMVNEGLTPPAILTPEALENAIILLHAIGGSSNIVIHLMALAEELGIGDRINLDTFEYWGKKIPCIANIHTHGKYNMTDLDEYGGVRSVMKNVEHYLHGDAMTVNGKTVGENLKGVKELDTDIVRPLNRPVHSRGLVVLNGNLATSSIVRFSVFPKALLKFSGPARVFDSEHEALDGLKHNRIKPGDAVVARYEGPKGGPGIPDLNLLLKEMEIAGLGDKCPLITDGKFSGFYSGPYICQVTPEAAVGGPLAAVKDNDIIEIDVVQGKIGIKIPDEELRERLSAWKPKEPKVKRGYLTLWERMANPASKGAGLPYNL